jgi:outer membrane protein assembly factor BamA
LKNTLAERNKLISFYENFERVEKHQINAEIEELDEQIIVVKQEKEAQIKQLEIEKNERMEKMRKEMLLEVKQVKTDMLNFTEDKL